MYYLIIVQNDETPAVFAYTSYDEALARFHSELAYRAEGRISTKCMILDGDLVMTDREVWTAPVD